MSGTDTVAPRLIGRDRELRTLAELVEAATRAGGGALLVRGEAGIGKSSLLEAARAHAETSGHQTLTTTGIESESRFPFAGLHQLLRPVLDEIGRLPDS